MEAYGLFCAFFAVVIPSIVSSRIVSFHFEISSLEHFLLVLLSGLCTGGFLWLIKPLIIWIPHALQTFLVYVQEMISQTWIRICEICNNFVVGQLRNLLSLKGVLIFYCLVVFVMIAGLEFTGNHDLATAAIAFFFGLPIAVFGTWEIICAEYWKWKLEHLRKIILERLKTRHSPLNILLIGPTGSGKSTHGNSTKLALNGDDVGPIFTTGNRDARTTRQLIARDVLPDHLKFFDTPGFVGEDGVYLIRSIANGLNWHNDPELLRADGTLDRGFLDNPKNQLKENAAHQGLLVVNGGGSNLINGEGAYVEATRDFLLSMLQMFRIGVRTRKPVLVVTHCHRLPKSQHQVLQDMTDLGFDEVYFIDYDEKTWLFWRKYEALAKSLQALQNLDFGVDQVTPV